MPSSDEGGRWLQRLLSSPVVMPSLSRPTYRRTPTPIPRHRTRAISYSARTYQQGRQVTLALVADQLDQTDYTKAVKAGLIYGLAWVFASTASGLGFLQF